MAGDKEQEEYEKIAKKRPKGRLEAGEAPAKSRGSSLPKKDREKMEAAFGQDLGKVRIHTGKEAQEAAKQLGAKAIIDGNDIYFAKSSPKSEMIAHEVAHVVQQGGRSVKGKVIVSK